MCEECGKRPATVHLTDFVEGQAVLRHLCEQCYAEKEGGVVLPPSAVLAQLVAAVAPELREMATQQCPACGIRYLEFRESMRLGCPNDYEAFQKALEPLLESIHGATQHAGKVPPQADDAAATQGRIRSLQRRQEKAVAAEDYELAAELRDRIKELENGPDEPEG